MIFDVLFEVEIFYLCLNQVELMVFTTTTNFCVQPVVFKYQKVVT